MVMEDSPIKEILPESGVVLKPMDIAGRVVWSDGSGKDFYKLDSVRKTTVVLKRGKQEKR